MADEKAILIILDGYGIAKNPDVSAIDKAQKPFIDSLFANNPHSHLTASGEAVGLPEGQFGNSEVGHLNIGAGRIVWQDISRINKSIKDGDFFQNPTLLEAAQKAKEKGKWHIMGLFSDGGVHSHNNQLFTLLELAKKQGIEHTYVHAFTDGRDTDPKSGKRYAQELNAKAKELGTGKLASIIGRYYAMDRDNRWERISLAYDLLVRGKGTFFESSDNAFDNSYSDNITDEFIKPVLLDNSSTSRIEPGDVVIFYNFRGDRARQITRALTEDHFDAFEVESNLNLHYICFTQYDATFKNVKLAFDPISMKNVIGEVVSDAKLPQLRIAETEKYPHVTYFFNGGEEQPFPLEKRILVPSPKVATYDLQPEMSAPEVTDKLCAELIAESANFVVLNFANPDMVGHTGDMDAAIKAVETVDQQLKRVVEAGIDHGYQFLIIADHGNADCLRNPDGSPHTAHTTALVPCLFVNVDGAGTVENGILADVAPTLLKMLGITQPTEMTGKPLY